MDNIRCSGLSRVMTCAGSLFFKDLPFEPTNAAAEEGTAAGEYLERLLTNQDMPTHARNGIEFDDDMKFYTTEIAEKLKGMAHSPILCETRIDWASRSGLIVKGSYDASFTVGNTLHIVDLKYGWGIVEVEENWQVLGYAIGEVIRQGRAFDHITMTIAQPRPHHELGPFRSWTLTYPELLKYKDRIDAHLDKIDAGFNDLVTSSSCKYCKAVIACPAFGKAAYRGIEVAQAFIQDSIDNDELSFQLDLYHRVAETFKSKIDSLETLAVSRLSAGQLVPNYITDQRWGDRKWKKDVNPDMMKLLTGRDIIEKVMLSPAKVEKLGVPKDVIGHLVDRFQLPAKLKKCDTSKLGNKIFGGPNA